MFVCLSRHSPSLSSLSYLTHSLPCSLSGGFEDLDVPHVEQDVNPVRDLEIIRDELLLKDIETIEVRYTALTQQVERGMAKDKKAELEIITKIRTFLNEEKKDIRCGEWNLADVE